MSRKRIYVGVWTDNENKVHGREYFDSKETPTEESHGNRYKAVIGPFRTARGAKAMVFYGFNNPHIQSVADAERVGKEHAEELKALFHRKVYPFA